MRFATLALLTGLVIAGFTAPAFANDDATDIAAIRKVMSDTEAAWNRGDIETFAAGYKDSPDTTFVGASVRKGFQPILASYRKNYANKDQMGKLTYSDIDVRVLPCADGKAQYAIVTGRFHLDRSAHGTAAKDDGIFSLVWEKTKDGWKMIHDHTS